MTFRSTVDSDYQAFEEDALHRPKEAARRLAGWAGSVWHQDRYHERFGGAGSEPSDITINRERHLATNLCNGRSCDCRYLRLALAAFDRERLSTTRRRYITTSTVVVNSVFAMAAFVTAFALLDSAESLTSDRGFSFGAGISGGLLVATMQMVFVVTARLL